MSSAGVTRPDRPGLDLSKQPPAVRLNKELGFILTYKLKVFITNFHDNIFLFYMREGMRCFYLTNELWEFSPLSKLNIHEWSSL